MLDALQLLCDCKPAAAVEAFTQAGNNPMSAHESSDSIVVGTRFLTQKLDKYLTAAVTPSQDIHVGSSRFSGM